MENTYETDNLGLAAYLYLRGPEYIGTKIAQGRQGSKKVFFIFENDASICQSLAREYMVSSEKQYRDCIFALRASLEEALKGK